MVCIGCAWSQAVAAQTNIRIARYSDGNEGEVLVNLLKRFEAANPGIKVAVDQMPFKASSGTIPVQLASGQGPDMVRVTDFGGVARHALDLRPHLSDPGYCEKNFGPFLEWMRVEGDTSSIPGSMTQLTITGPFVDKTLFEQAGIPLPSERAAWDDWVKAAKAVAEKTQAPFPIDQGYPYSRPMFNVVISRLGQAISGEMSLDEAYKRIDADIKQQIAERKR